VRPGTALRQRKQIARSLRTQQRAYDPEPPTAPFHAPPRGAVLGAGRTPAAELVSVPPSSTTQTTRGGSDAIHRLVLAWPCTDRRVSGR
jgi:hypothetical protein